MVLATAPPAHAQLSARFGVAVPNYVSHSTALQLAPRFDWGDAHNSGSVEGSYSSFTEGGWAAQFSARDAHQKSFRGFVAGSDASLETVFLNGGIWAGSLQQDVGAGRMLGGVLGSIAAGGGVLRDIGGTFRPLGSLRAAAGIHQLVMKVQHTFVHNEFTDLSVGFAGGSDRLSGALSLGLRFSPTGHHDVSSAQLAWQVVPAVAFEAMFGDNAASPEGFPDGRYFGAGVRVEAVHKTRQPRIERTATGARVEIRTGGRDVSIAGDWNNWTPIPMTQASPGHWVVELPIGPGAHKFALTVDGRTVVPPGFPRLPDGFGGEVGLLVL